MPNTILLDPSAGTPGVIKIAGTCYQYFGPSSSLPDHSSFDSSPSDCDSCFCSCGIPSQVTVSGSVYYADDDPAVEVSFEATLLQNGSGSYRYGGDVTSSYVSGLSQSPTTPAILNLQVAFYCNINGWAGWGTNFDIALGDESDIGNLYAPLILSCSDGNTLTGGGTVMINNDAPPHGSVSISLG